MKRYNTGVTGGRYENEQQKLHRLYVKLTCAIDKWSCIKINNYI